MEAITSCPLAKRRNLFRNWRNVAPTEGERYDGVMEAILGFQLPTAAKEGLHRREYRQRKAYRTIPKLQTALAPRNNAGVQGPGCVANCPNRMEVPFGPDTFYEVRKGCGGRVK